MISIKTYSEWEIDLLYSIIEEAVQNQEAVKIYKASNIVKSGDLYYIGEAANGSLFKFEGLLWEGDDGFYDCLIQPQYRGDVFPSWIPVIANNQRKGCGSGDLSMIMKENRFHKLNQSVIDHHLKDGIQSKEEIN